ncbi:MAG: hypothetical protein V1838_03305 [Patescibacteria group bacterium]
MAKPQEYKDEVMEFASFVEETCDRMLIRIGECNNVEGSPKLVELREAWRESKGDTAKTRAEYCEEFGIPNNIFSL